MYTSLVPHIKAMEKKVIRAIDDASYENHCWRCMSGASINGKLFRIQEMFSKKEYQNSVLADNLVMLEWVKEQQLHKEQKLLEQDAINNGFQASSNFAFGCHIKYR